MSKSSIRTNFYHQKPGNGRKSFIILRLDVRDGAKKTSKVNSESLDAVNAAYISGQKSLDACTVLVKEIIQGLYKELERTQPKIVHNSANRQLLDRFWEAEYEHRDLVDPSTAKNAFNRAIEAVGELSLYTATREELQKQVAKNVSGNAQRKVVTDLNLLLKFIKRDVKLRKNKKQRVEVAYLSLDDFKKTLKFINDVNIRYLAQAAFFTGCRIGELFAIKPQNVVGKFLLVQKQIDRGLDRRDTKNRTERKAFIVPEGLEALKNWSEVEKKSEYRNLKLSEIFKAACKKAFPNDESKWITFHDLRHSYAIHLLSKHVSLSLVSQSLGNSIPVCQEYYAGFVLSDESIESIASKFGSN